MKRRLLIMMLGLFSLVQTANASTAIFTVVNKTGQALYFSNPNPSNIPVDYKISGFPIAKDGSGTVTVTVIHENNFYIWYGLLIKDDNGNFTSSIAEIWIGKGMSDTNFETDYGHDHGLGDLKVDFSPTQWNGKDNASFNVVVSKNQDEQIKKAAGKAHLNVINHTGLPVYVEVKDYYNGGVTYLEGTITYSGFPLADGATGDLNLYSNSEGIFFGKIGFVAMQSQFQSATLEMEIITENSVSTFDIWGDGCLEKCPFGRMHANIDNYDWNGKSDTTITVELTRDAPTLK